MVYFSSKRYTWSLGMSWTNLFSISITVIRVRRLANRIFMNKHLIGPYRYRWSKILYYYAMFKTMLWIDLLLFITDVEHFTAFFVNIEENGEIWKNTWRNLPFHNCYKVKIPKKYIEMDFIRLGYSHLTTFSLIAVSVPFVTDRLN